MAILKIQLLGEFHLEYNGALLPTVGTQRLQSLLAYLLVHRAAPQPRQHMAFLLWPDSPEAQARTNLRNLLHSLREALPDSERYLSLEGQNLQWRTDAPYRLDVEEFEKAIKQKDSPESLEQAVALYRGDLLPGCYDEWVLPERERIEREFIGTLERLIALLEARQQYSQALTYADRLRAQDPLREGAYRKQMHLLGLMGDRAGVMRVYQNCKAVLAQELGEDVEPSPETKQAYAQALKPNPPAQLSAPEIPAQPSPQAQPGSSSPALLPGGPTWIRPVDRGWDLARGARRLARSAGRQLVRARDPVNVAVPVAVLGILVLALNLNLYLSLFISIAVYVGLYLVLNPRTGGEQAKNDLRNDILGKLDAGRERTAQIRRLQARVRKQEVRDRMARICDRADNILDKLSADQGTSLATAARLEDILSETGRILELYLQIIEEKVVAHPDNLTSSVVKIEQDLLDQIESFLLDFQAKLDRGDMIDLETSIRVMLERLRLEGLG